MAKQEAIPRQLEGKLSYQLDDLAGVGNEADEIEFLENTKPFREIETNSWK
ncbi:hypothetical protein [Okeania sp.]|uniref:hypothetical protein n=1 Tax=Okeania sp. TaxID=3100323 RepID=UPI002B4B84DF|nr:hypothetical protein [Okeania sp.]MEB3341085.1 hypothetical protein [Okeania sp.]